MPCIHLCRAMDGSSRETLAELNLNLDETAPEWSANRLITEVSRATTFGLMQKKNRPDIGRPSIHRCVMAYIFIGEP